MSTSPRVFIVLDPCQDYDESTTILGVYGSLGAAKIAAQAVRSKTTVYPDHHYAYTPNSRSVEIQEWQGSQVLDAWDYSLERPTWKTTRANP